MPSLLPRRASLSALVVLSLASAPIVAERHGDGQREGLGQDRPIRVDCTQGGSIARALDMFPGSTGQITIEINGFCEEAVDISRPVIIRGTNPATDGISGPASIGNRTGLVVIFGVTGFGLTGSEMVRLEHLTVKNSPNLAVTVNLAQVAFDDVTISDNASHALLTFAGANVTATNLTVTGNGGTGLFGASGNLRCTDCQLTNNSTRNAGAAEVHAGTGGIVSLINTGIVGRIGLQSHNDGQIAMSGGSIDAQQRALNIQNYGHVSLQGDVQLSGSIVCGLRGTIDSRRGSGTNGFTQLTTASGGNNQMTNGCFMLVGAGTTVLVGQTNVSVGAYVGTEGGAAATVKFSALSCSNGGKVTTTGGNVFVNNVPGTPAACGT